MRTWSHLQAPDTDHRLETGFSFFWQNRYSKFNEEAGVWFLFFFFFECFFEHRFEFWKIGEKKKGVKKIVVIENEKKIPLQVDSGEQDFHITTNQWFLQVYDEFSNHFELKKKSDCILEQHSSTC